MNANHDAIVNRFLSTNKRRERRKARRILLFFLLIVFTVLACDKNSSSLIIYLRHCGESWSWSVIEGRPINTTDCDWGLGGPDG